MISLEEKIGAVKENFSHLKSSEDIYTAIISFGKQSPLYPKEHKTEENRIAQCQSSTYIYSWFSNGKIFFQTTSDSLISSGLSALLRFIYNDQSPETILKNPPSFFKEFGIEQSLSPSRSNGLYHMYVRIQKDALKFLAEKNKGNI